MLDDDRDLIIRALDDDLSAAERKRLDVLLRTSPEARAEQRAHHTVRALVAKHGNAPRGPAFTEAVMERLPPAAAPPASPAANAQARGDRAAAPPSRSAGRRTGAAWQQAGWALATLAVLVGLSVWLGLWTQTVAVPPGARDTVSLPDGSVVELSAGSTLRYAPFWWPGPRTVTLDGEAFFDVAPDDDAFAVETFNARVVVTGTQFNVRAWRDDPAPRTTVALTEGRVHVARRAPAAAPVTLRPGETSIVASDTTETVAATTLPMDRVLAWRSGGLAFVDQPLASALRELERRFAVHITLADSALGTRPLTYLNPQPASARAALTDICHVLGLRFHPTADGFTVRRP